VLNQALLCFLIITTIACYKSEELTVLDISAVEVRSEGGLTYVDSQLYTGVLTGHTAEGVLISKISYVKGKLDGEYETWHHSGQLKESRFFRNNKKTGEHRGYWSNGAASYHYAFNDGLYVDTLKEWYINGQLYKLEYYQDGKQFGRQKAWKKDGELYLNYDVINGRKYGNTGIKHCKSLWNEVDSSF